WRQCWVGSAGWPAASVKTGSSGDVLGSLTGHNNRSPPISTMIMAGTIMRDSPLRPTKIAIRLGVRNETERPVVAYSPYISPAALAVVNRPRNARDEDWTGPTKKHRNNPQIQNASVPSWTKMMTAEAISPCSETRMMRLGPTLSSNSPPQKGPAAATTFAAIPKNKMSPGSTP